PIGEPSVVVDDSIPQAIDEKPPSAPRPRLASEPSVDVDVTDDVVEEISRVTTLPEPDPPRPAAKPPIPSRMTPPPVPPRIPPIKPPSIPSPKGPPPKP